MANSEFWRELKPIEQKFRPGALPEAYIADAPTEDDRFYAPLSETVGTRPLWISPSQNRWCDVLMCRGAGLVNRHYHPQQVFAYTISGKWGYLEHDWIATAGDWVYEAPGESHTLIAYECDEPMRVTFNVTGPLIWLDENGEPNGTFDVFLHRVVGPDQRDVVEHVERPVRLAVLVQPDQRPGDVEGHPHRLVALVGDQRVRLARRLVDPVARGGDPVVLQVAPLARDRVGEDLLRVVVPVDKAG